MKLLFLTLLFICAYSKSSEYLNSFSGDVDIYDMGTMGRGKNAASWHRSLADKQEVFYYLAMQPWRHLVWTFYDTTDKVWYKSTINEDASAVPAANSKTKLKNDISNDYCRKEYAHPMPTYDIDWTGFTKDTVLEAVDINGITCYKYPAQVPLAHIYLKEQFLKESDMNGATVCRFDYIGGKSITFRSFGAFSEAFIKDDSKDPTSYLNNKTKCNIDPSPNNVDTDLAIVLGISDTITGQAISEKLSQLKELDTVKQTKVYYISGETVKAEVIGDNAWNTIKNKQITPGSVDAAITRAKNDLIKRINDKAIYRGTIIVLMDRKLSSPFNAEKEFDRNDITVHTVVYNAKGDLQLRQRAVSLLSVGDHYHEFTASSQASTIVNDLFIGIRVNLTERCNRTTCNGFCDGRDRCTCPMCCENTCNFTYCDINTASCKPWPEGNPKPKIKCEDDCVGTQECKDFEGCVYTHYNPGCEPSSKCMRPYCNDDKQCDQESICENDQKPSKDNMCWSYKCDETTGNCVRDQHGNACPKLDSLCDEYYCDGLVCDTRPKECAKTAPYDAMDCYMAKCNPKTGMCENALNCTGNLGLYSGCGKTADQSLCKCDASSGFKCSCGTSTDGFCSTEEICDGTNENVDPSCRSSKCGQDLYIDGCQIKTCNEVTEEIEWVDYPCSEKVSIIPNTDKKADVELYCMDKYGIFCKTDKDNKAVCYADIIPGQTEEGGCGLCSMEKQKDKVNGKDVYVVSYTEDCSYLVPKCPNGDEIPNAEKYFKGKEIAKCQAIKQGNEVIRSECVFNEVINPKDLCIECFKDSVSCYKATEYRAYTFVSESGECDYDIIKTAPQCSKCNDGKDGFYSTCDDQSLEKEYEFTQSVNSKTFKYSIPKECYPGNQCVPVHEFNCMDETREDLKKIIDSLKTCSSDGIVKGKYHYPEYPVFDEGRYLEGKAQKQEFLDVVEQEAYCEWNIEIENCHYCSFDDGSDILTNHDKCHEEWVNKYGEKSYINVYCNIETNECLAEHNSTCNMKECFYFEPSDLINSTSDCVNTTDTSCKTAINELDAIKKAYEQAEKIGEQHECSHEIKCHDDEITCTLEKDSTVCAELVRKYEKENYDFGCRKPVADCDFSIMHCVYVPMTHPSEDTKFFQQRDKVVFGDLCYNYTCSETCDEETGKCEHHWVLTPESEAELHKEPAICEVNTCNPKTGKSEGKVIECLVSDEFPQIDEQKAECFECKCSYQNGQMVLSMKPNTDDLIYELDACGNCKVLERKTGKQVNDPVPCILEGATNLTGAIAGASVAASVVFGLIGSMVVVSIGALQTYKLVSSAMKNVISTTLENPEFVAADNEATNVLNNE